MVLLANAGLPALIVLAPYFLGAIFPIVLIESFVISRAIMAPMRGRVLSAVTRANAVSTIIGIPITWVLLVILQLIMGGGQAVPLEGWFSRVWRVTVQAPWFLPYEDQPSWMIPVACAALMIPFCLASIAIEESVLEKRLDDAVPIKKIWRAVILANILSYVGLVGVYLGWAFL